MNSWLPQLERDLEKLNMTAPSPAAASAAAASTSKGPAPAASATEEQLGPLKIVEYRKGLRRGKEHMMCGLFSAMFNAVV
jgi:hypothetical protein